MSGSTQVSAAEHRIPWKLAVLSLLSAVVAGAISGCGGADPADSPDAQGRPLSQLPYFVEKETARLDFSDPASYPALGRGFLLNTRALFSRDNLVFAVEPHAEVHARVLAPRPLRLHLRMLPNYLPGAGPQHVQVFWEDTPLGAISFSLERKWGIEQAEFEIPVEIQKTGINHVRFLSRYALSQVETGDGKETRAAAFGLLSLELAFSDTAAAPPTAGDVRMEGGNIEVPAGTRAIFPVLCGGTEVALQMQGAEGSGAVYAAWDTHGGRVERLVSEIDGGTGEVQASLGELKSAWPRPGAIEIILQSAPGVKALFRDPRLTFVPAPQGQGNEMASLSVNASQIRNVVLVILDALQADALHCYGNPYPTTPYLDELAARGTLLERYYAAGSFTFSSTASLLTSLYPFQHGVRYYKDRLGDEALLLQNALRAGGIYTACISQNPFVSPENSTARGFDQFVPVFSALPGRNEAAVASALEVTSKLQDKPFFLYAHFLPPHSPYSMAGPHAQTFSFDLVGELPIDSNEMKKINLGKIPYTQRGVEQLRLRYFEGLRLADDMVRRLVEGMQAQGYGPETLIIVTSDHGEEFMEHGWIGHGSFPFDTMLHIPFIAATVAPGSENNGAARVTEIRSAVDLFPTICELLEAPHRDAVMGTSLLRVRDGVSQVLAHGSGNQGFPVEAFYFDGFKLLLSTVHDWRALYNTTSDPGETVNLALVQPVLADYFQAIAMQWKQKHAALSAAPEQPATNSIEHEEELKSLGYL